MLLLLTMSLWAVASTDMLATLRPGEADMIVKSAVSRTKEKYAFNYSKTEELNAIPVYTQLDPFIQNTTWSAYVTLETTKLLAHRLGLSADSIVELEHVPTRLCPTPNINEDCMQFTYRELSGVCNNPLHPTWGAANQPFQRLLEPVYHDGVETPKVGPILSNDDLIFAVNQSLTQVSGHLTILTSLWGTMLAEDIGTPIPYYDGYAVRSVPSPKVDCVLGRREQLNPSTSFLDMSYIYGNSDEQMSSLRTFVDGMLHIPQGDFMRVLLAHNHNHMSRKLKTMNPQWSDEMCFQEARKIIVAKIQHVTFNEFLPVVLSPVTIEKYQLGLHPLSYSFSYDPEVNPDALNAAMSVVMKLFALMRPKQLSSGSYHDQFREAFTKSSKKMEFPEDNIIEVTRNIIDMERDHGISPYTYWRRVCNMSEVRSFEDLRDIISVPGLERLRSIYRSVHDIELAIGGLYEHVHDGGIFGPTFSCILGIQMSILRKGDRFWYENYNSPHSLSRAQLKSVRQMTLSHILCSNYDNGIKIQANPFIVSDTYLNTPIPCSVMPTVKFSPWKIREADEEEEIDIPYEVVTEAFNKARENLNKKLNQEMKLFQLDQVAKKGSPQSTAYSFHRPSSNAIKWANNSFFLELTTRELFNSIPWGNRRQDQSFNIKGFKRFRRSPQDLAQVINQIQAPQLLPIELPRRTDCGLTEDNQPCDPKSAFRSYSGRCNNILSPDAGMALRPFLRLLEPVYEDGVSRPRALSKTSNPLPSPRVVSTFMHDDVSRPHERYTLMLMQFGQFLDHDITLTPINTGFQRSILDCRDCESAIRVHPECYPIGVPTNDPFYHPVNLTNGRPFCIPFTRSLPAQLSLGPRQQMNQNTAVLDASPIYGSDICESYSLRIFNAGKLNATLQPLGRGRELMPQGDHFKDCESSSGLCFQAGDSRASEQPGLAAIHTVFMRQHNNLVDQMARINPHWDDERLYQTVRKIMGGFMQHITYNEFLPRILGWSAVKVYELDLLQQGYYDGYDPTCSPSAFNEFGTAAFRFGHSLIRPSYFRMDQFYKVRAPEVRLRNNFNNPDKLYEVQMIDEILRGLVSTAMESMDQHITKEVTNHLFEKENIPFSGLDLAALNVQRGRDHGLQPYNEYRAICHLKRAVTFEDLSREISADNIERLKRVYATVDDIDLFPGGLLENPLEGGLIGPTFGCIIGLQFRQLRKCDRFWYESADPIVRFTEGQLAELKKISLARLMCENCEVIDQIQRRVFDIPHPFLNPRIPCQAISGVSLEPWRDLPTNEPSCRVGNQVILVGRSAEISPCTRCTCTIEGASCYSVNIQNCQQLIQKYSIESLLSDNVCRTQCGSFFPQRRITPAIPIIKTK